MFKKVHVFFLEHPARVFTKFALIKDTDETIQTELFTERIKKKKKTPFVRFKSVI